MTQSRLLDFVRNTLRTYHYSLRTEQSYIQWIKRFILFHKKRHPNEMAEQEITEFLTFLAVQKHVAASTQNQALSAILFLYKKVLNKELAWMEDIVRARRPEHLPEVLSRDDTLRLINHLSGVYRLLAALIYGSGMRLMEAMRLRIQDVDFDYQQIIVRSGKGNKDRITLLPERLLAPLRKQIAYSRTQ